MNKKRRRRKLETRRALIGWMFIIPNFVGFFIFTLIPVTFAFALSFTDWDGFSKINFTGLDNFITLASDETFHISFFNTVYFAVFNIVLTLAIALGLAVLLNKKLKGKNFFRGAVFFPYVASNVAVATVWNMLFQKDFGPINEFLRFLGVQNPPGWTASTEWAMIAVILVSVWKGMGYYMVIYLAGLQGIPNSLYEAATVDGANGWQKFWKITVPMLASTSFFVLMMLTINSFKVFDLVFVMTEGGPGRSTLTLANYIYKQGFEFWNYGMSSAISMVLFAIVGTLTVVQTRLEKNWTNY